VIIFEYTNPMVDWTGAIDLHRRFAQGLPQPIDLSITLV
jgi:hypothetical protein